MVIRKGHFSAILNFSEKMTEFAGLLRSNHLTYKITHGASVERSHPYPSFGTQFLKKLGYASGEAAVTSDQVKCVLLTTGLLVYKQTRHC